MTDYQDLVNVEDIWAKKENFKDERWDVVFYCKNCEQIVSTKRIDPRKYIFECEKCKSRDISIGTQEWIKTNYRVS